MARIPLMVAVLVTAASAAPREVRLESDGGAARLLREGAPFRLLGVGGDGDKALLRALGGNCLRTWAVDGLGEVLDEAERLGLGVVAGVWLGHPRHGFDYGSVEQVARQREEVRQAVERWREHPALLMWALGNEAEGDGADAAYWSALDSLAAVVHRLDPAHPTMTVISEVGGPKVANLHRLCPEIDAVGINSYAGAASVGQRYREAGGSKPWALTEFGPPGTWEVARTPWGAPLEPTSTEKAAWFTRAWEASASDPLCLGGFAFNWGTKMEMTATWFGMLLPDGSRLGACDVLQEAWSGKPPADRCPAIDSLTLAGEPERDPGELLEMSLTASDPEGDDLAAEWVLQSEQDQPGTGGDWEGTPPVWPEALLDGDATGARLRLPEEPGAFRVLVTVRDGHGGAATANIPVLARGAVSERPARAASLPLVIYGEATQPEPPYAPSGWMGNAAAIRLDPACEERPFAGKTCLRCEFGSATEWGGVVWQDPPDDWGDRAGGWDVSGATRLAFRVRGARGGEVVSFEFGLIGPEKPSHDSARRALKDLTLTDEWAEYSIPLAGLDLSRIKTGFSWVVAGQGAPVVFYLDDVRYE